MKRVPPRLGLRQLKIDIWSSAWLPHPSSHCWFQANRWGFHYSLWLYFNKLAGLGLQQLQKWRFWTALRDENWAKIVSELPCGSGAVFVLAVSSGHLWHRLAMLKFVKVNRNAKPLNWRPSHFDITRFHQGCNSVSLPPRMQVERASGRRSV